MTMPSTRDLLKKFRLIEEGNNKKLKINEEAGPADVAISKGDKIEITSQDGHSGKVKQTYGQGSSEAPKSYDGNDQSVNKDVKNDRKEGSEKAEEKFTGSDKPVSDNFKMKKGSNKTVAAAQDADKDFANYRERIRAAMRGGLVKPIDKPEFKGNKGLNEAEELEDEEDLEEETTDCEDEETLEEKLVDPISKQPYNGNKGLNKKLSEKSSK